jgi:gamma-glutamyltranspeptidase / glutathione hydrolase
MNAPSNYSLTPTVGRGMVAGRPDIAGTRHMASAGHYLASLAAFHVLEDGGNAIDAGVAAGLALGVVQSDLVNVAGVAPIMIKLGKTGEVVTISGLGWWPKALDPTLFQREHDSHVPRGILRQIIPAAPDAWLLALERYGTMSFGEVATSAIRLAEGFVMYPLMADYIATFKKDYAEWSANAAVYLPNGEPPKAGEVFVQRDLARTLRFLVDEESKASAKGGRIAGLKAARAAFYEGDIARAITKYHEENGGLLRMEDFAGYRSAIEAPVSLKFNQHTVYACGPWCQGPALLQALSVLDPDALKEMGHNSTAYLHSVTEALKLAFADRERFYGDPRFIDVPIERLLSPAYAAERKRMIRPDEAWQEMPPGGEIDGYPRPLASKGDPQLPLDTSYACVSDRWGNVFSATPSDVSNSSPMVPGIGLVPSSRGSQSWGDPKHPSAAAPGKRPRLTPNPAIAIGPNGEAMPFGTPGGDVQSQAMLQVFLNRTVFGMSLQESVEAPRLASFSFPDSFEPHTYLPGKLMLEARLAKTAMGPLRQLGHDVDEWQDGTWRAGAVCIIEADAKKGLHIGAADPRRACYAVGW